MYQQTALSPKLSVLEISTLWHFRLPLLIQMFIKVASSPRLSGIGMPSPILWSHLLKMQRIVLLSSLLWWELGTNSLITGPGEWLSFRRFTGKLSWSWPFICMLWLRIVTILVSVLLTPCFLHFIVYCYWVLFASCLNCKVSVLLKRIDCVLLSVLLAHLHTNFCAINTQIKHYVLLACCLCVSVPSFFIWERTVIMLKT